MTVGTDALSANYNGLWPELGHWTHPVDSSSDSDTQHSGAILGEVRSQRSEIHVWFKTKLPPPDPCDLPRLVLRHLNSL